MEKNQGPTTFTVTETRCSGCEFHTQKMIYSGMDPLYHHYCKHPDSPNNFDVFYKDEGTFIGRNNITPDWCPFIKK